MQQQQALGVHVSTCQDSVKRADRLRPNDFLLQIPYTAFSAHTAHSNTALHMYTSKTYRGVAREQPGSTHLALSAL